MDHWIFIATAILAAWVMLSMVPLGTAVETPALSEAPELFAAPAPQSPHNDWWRDALQTHDQRIAWWRNARFGMFIHWGVYSALAGEWQGEPVSGYAEHIQRKCRIPMDVYRKEVVGKFNPVRFDADEWARLAKEAGMGYMVITAKHHDGFAMYDSQVSDYDIVDATPWAVDPMKLLKEATRRQGIRFGFYYSQAWDWGDKHAPGNDWDYDNPGGDRNLHGGREWWNSSHQHVVKAQQYVDGKAIPQLQELIRNYDPDLIWFDTPNKLSPYQNWLILRATRLAGRDVVINSRCISALADYQSTADRPAEFPPHEGDWEAIPTTNESYGYHRADLSHKPVAHFIELIAKAAARGGNLMLNVGPRGDGTIDEADVAILRGIGKWMSVNGESIHGTTRTPLPVQPWGESTRKGNKLYLHVFDWPRDGQLVLGGLKSNVTGAHLLADSSRAPLTVRRQGELDLRIDVPSTAPDAVDSVIVIECDGEPIADPARLLLPTHRNTLHVFDGRLHGGTFKFGQGKRENAYIEQWRSAIEFVSWQVRVTVPITFHIDVQYDAPAAGGEYAIKVAGQSLAATVRQGNELSQALGTVRLEPGVHDLRVVPIRIVAEELMRLRAVQLKAAGGDSA